MTEPGDVAHLGHAGRGEHGAAPSATADLKPSSRLFINETRAPVPDPGRGRTSNGYLWALARDDRPWGGTDPPGVVYVYVPGRAGAHGETILDGFSGIPRPDGYAGYNRLRTLRRRGGALTPACCWAHVRRRFYEIARTGKAPIAEEGLP